METKTNIRQFDLKLDKDTYTPAEVQEFLKQKTEFDKIYNEKELKENYVSKENYSKLEAELNPFRQAAKDKKISKDAETLGIKKFDKFKRLKAYDKFAEIEDENERRTFVETLQKDEPELFDIAPVAPELTKGKEIELKEIISEDKIPAGIDVEGL